MTETTDSTQPPDDRPVPAPEVDYALVSEEVVSGRSRARIEHWLTSTDDPERVLAEHRSNTFRSRRFYFTRMTTAHEVVSLEEVRNR